MNLTQKTIVIVEEEPDPAKMFTETMRMSGYEIVKTYSGGSTIPLILKEKTAAVESAIHAVDQDGIGI
jgi:response regulator RpfG family c-di-GMP phosphodiesterase